MKFIALISLLVIQRLYEMKLGEKNLAALSGKLLQPIDQQEKKQMLLLHSSWFVAILLEYAWHGQMVAPKLFGLATVVLIVCQWVRYQTMQILGYYWVPFPVSFKGQLRLTEGLYRYIRHPNYWVVVVELFLVPWMGGCHFVMGIWGILNVFFILRRIKIEEIALARLEST